MTMSATSPPGSPQLGPPSPVPDPWLALLLHSCLADPGTTLDLSPNLHATLLAGHEAVPEVDDLLCKHLARALVACTETSAPSCTIFHLVTALRELMSSLNFRLHVQEPFFSQLKDGSKAVEGRCAVGAYNSILPGDLLLFNNTFTVAVQRVKHYNSFKKMLEVEGMGRVLPGVASIKEGIAIYRQFYSEEKELSGGVLAIHVERVAEERQPLTIVRTILKELGTCNGEGFVVKMVD